MTLTELRYIVTLPGAALGPRRSAAMYHRPTLSVGSRKLEGRAGVMIFRAQARARSESRDWRALVAQAQ